VTHGIQGKSEMSDYFNQIGLPAPGPGQSAPSPKGMNGESNSWKQALDRAHDLRKFEIDLSWKRATYFWAFQATAFATIGLSSKDGSVHPHIVLFAAMLGAVTGFVGYLSARGSKFWQQNWESHVDMLEEHGGDGRLTQIILTKGDLQHSVSRLNSALLLLLTLGWFALLFVFGFPNLRTFIHNKLGDIAELLPLLIALISVFTVYCATRTDIDGEVVRENSNGPRLHRDCCLCISISLFKRQTQSSIIVRRPAVVKKNGEIKQNAPTAGAAGESGKTEGVG
jgi:hypothetical protein